MLYILRIYTSESSYLWRKTLDRPTFGTGFLSPILILSTLLQGYCTFGGFNKEIRLAWMLEGIGYSYLLEFPLASLTEMTRRGWCNRFAMRRSWMKRAMAQWKRAPQPYGEWFTRHAWRWLEILKSTDSCRSQMTLLCATVNRITHFISLSHL